jgi:hypothetical protein
MRFLVDFPQSSHELHEVILITKQYNYEPKAVTSRRRNVERLNHQTTVQDWRVSHSSY